MADMGQLMHHHILDGLRGIGHQVQGEAETVFPGAAAEPCPGGGDPDPGGPDAHDPGPIGHPLRQKDLGLPAKGLLLLRGGFRVFRPIPGLTLLLAMDPCLVLFHEGADLLLRESHGRPHYHAAGLVYLQGHGAAAAPHHLIVRHRSATQMNRGP